MKKVLMIVVLSGITVTGVFAQLNFRFYNDFNTNLFGAFIPTGLYSQPIVKNDADVYVRNNTPRTSLEEVYLTPGGGVFIPKGDFSIFTPTIFAGDSTKNIGAVNELTLSASVTKGPFTGFFSFNFLDIFNNFVEINNRSMQEVWTAVRVDQFMAKADGQMFAFQVSNVYFPLNVDPYFDFTPWTKDFSIERFNVLLPGGDRVYQTLGPDFRAQLNTGLIFNYNRLNFIGTIKLLEHMLHIPIQVDLGMDLSKNWLGADPITGSSDPAQHRAGFSGVIRGLDIAGLVDFDVMYRVRGGDYTLDDSYHEDHGGGTQPDGVGRYAHFLSLAFGLPNLLPDIGISAAYIAHVNTFEDASAAPTATDQTTVKRRSPFYSGINLNMRYTGIPGLRLTLNNTVSFASAPKPETYDDNGTTKESVISFSAITSQPLGRDRSDSWFALYNGVSASYDLTRNMTLNMEAVHRMSISTTNDTREGKGNAIGDWDTSVITKNIVLISPYISLPLFAGADMQAGLTFYAENSKTTFSYKETPSFAGPRSWEGGAIALALPVRLIFVW